MNTWLALLLVGACSLGGWFAGYLHNPHGPGRYYSPELHQGRWGKPEIIGRSEGQLRVQWTTADPVWLRDAVAPGHRHDPMRCTIGPGMAHHDECVCGAQRSGVYGSWY